MLLDDARQDMLVLSQTVDLYLRTRFHAVARMEQHPAAAKE